MEKAGNNALKERNNFLSIAIKYKNAGNLERARYYVNMASQAEQTALKALKALKAQSNIKQRR